MDKKYIRFIDSNYNTLFHVANGESVRIRFEDGDFREYPCKYIDEAHTQIGNNVFHICEFAERMEQYGRSYEPVKEIGDLDFYKKKFFDLENTYAEGKKIPYFSLVERSFNKGTHEQADITYAYCFKPLSADKAFCKVVCYPNHSVEEGISKKEFSSDITKLCGDDVICNRINNIVQSIKEEQSLVKPALDNIISSCEKASKGVLKQTNKEEIVNERLLL